MQDQDFKWFCDNYNDIFCRFGTTFVAIKNKTILGTFKTYAEGIREISKTETPGTFIVQECNGSESGYTNYIASMNFC